MKKFLLLALVLVLCLPLSAQTPVTFKGKIKSTQSIEGRSFYLDNGPILSKIEVNSDGTFETTANYLEFPGTFCLKKISPKGKIEGLIPELWIDQASVEVEIDLDNNSYVLDRILPYQTLSEQMEAANASERIQLIKENSDQPPALYFLEKYKAKVELETLRSLVENLATESKKLSYTKQLESYIKAKSLNTPKIRGLVENFSLRNKSGTETPVLAKNGKKKIVALMSTGCSFSIASINLLEQMANKKTDNLEIISIWSDSSEAIWKNHHSDQKEKITWTDLWDQYDFAAQYFDKDITPTFLIIGADNTLLDSFHGYSKKSARKLSEALK